MKSILGKILKVLLVLLGCLLVVLLCFGVVLLLGWPWWVGIFVVAGVVGMVLGVLFIRKVAARKKEQKFVSDIVEQDAVFAEELDAKDKERAQDLQERWKEAVQALRKSQLAKRGNPLYVLPWYLVIGESGSGKTTAIESARLSSPFAEMSRTSGISGTRNCDWWFFEQAILLDTAGRYAIPVDEGKDKEEWQRFLSLLLRYRKKEPINGVVVTLAADKILQTDPEQLQQDGANIRRRLDELMRVLGVKFPVYLLVTKCDLIQGMTQFSELLPEPKLKEAMGAINDDLKTDALTFVHATLETVSDHLRNHRLLALHNAGDGHLPPPLLLFPEEFDKLRPGLEAFIRTAFKENPYQETPLLRGLHFSSGRQEGTPYSHFLQALGLLEERDVLQGTNRGLFLHDFFAQVLPKDRGLFAPTRQALQWRRLTRNIGVAAWVALILAVCGLMSFSFIKNLRALRSVSHEFVSPPKLSGDLARDIPTLQRFEAAILDLEAANRGWWIPRFQLNHSLEVEKALKTKFWKEYHDTLLEPSDRELFKTIRSFSETVPDERIAEVVSLLIRRIFLLEKRLTGSDWNDLAHMRQPDFRILFGSDVEAFKPTDPDEPSLDPSQELYLYSLLWRPAPDALSEEYSDLQSMLSQLMAGVGDLKWLVTWANRQDDLQDVRITDYWRGSGETTGHVFVPRAFTREGYERITGFVEDLEHALADPGIMKRHKGPFQQWYEAQYLENWLAFADDFLRGPELLQGRNEWHKAAAIMTTEKDPYARLLDRMSEEMLPLLQPKENPAWLTQLYRYEWLKEKAQAPELSSAEKGMLSKAAEKGKRLLGGLQRSADRLNAFLPKLDPAVVQHFKDFQAELRKMSDVAESRKAAYELMAKTYASDPASPEGSYFAALSYLEQWKDVLGNPKEPSASPVLRLVRGPADFLFEYARQEATCLLQQKWDEDVLGEIQGLSSAKAVEKLLVKGEGLVWKFIRGPAAPFLYFKIGSNYSPKEITGKQIPFKDEFFHFINRGAVAKNVMEEAKSAYDVEIKAYPTDSNRDARIKPHATRIVLQCDDGNQSLVNLQYPVKKIFHWSAETCSDVLFQIEVGDLTLTRRYTGQEAFPRFLRDFARGKRKFLARHFPKQRKELQAMGIREIGVRYRFKGHGPVIRLLGRTPRKIPRVIVSCSDS